MTPVPRCHGSWVQSHARSLAGSEAVFRGFFCALLASSEQASAWSPSRALAYPGRMFSGVSAGNPGSNLEPWDHAHMTWVNMGFIKNRWGVFLCSKPTAR